MTQRKLRTFDRLISHRFRGFKGLENTLESLKAALDFGVQLLEFDIRVSRCGVPTVYHDEYAKDGNGLQKHISQLMLNDFKRIGGRFRDIPTFEALLRAISRHRNTTAKFLVDIKDAGFETEIHSLVMLYGLEERVIYVSWLPEALYQMHAIAPTIPLCFSHWCKSPDNKTRQRHHVYYSKNGIIPRCAKTYIHGVRSGYHLDTPVSGEMRKTLKKTNGYVCVPRNMVNKRLVENYHDNNIRVSTFSYIDWHAIENHQNEMNIDLYFVDNKQVFDDL